MIPAGLMAFRRQRQWFDPVCPVPRPHINQPLSVMAWANEQYFLTFAPAADIDMALEAWLLKSFGPDSGARVSSEALCVVFPTRHRSLRHVSHYLGAI